jgi:hypothetical protein
MAMSTIFDPHADYLVVGTALGSDIRQALGLPGLSPAEIACWLIRAIAKNWQATKPAQRTTLGWESVGSITLAGRPCTLRLVRGVHRDGRPKLRAGRRVYFAQQITFEDAHAAT